MTQVANHTFYHIAGIGAVGTLFAGCFAQYGKRVQLILKDKPRLELYQSSLLELNTKDYSFVCHPSATTLDNLGDSSIDFLLCCTKAYDVLRVLSNLRAHIHAKTTIILLHNGLGVIEEIQAAMPELRIITALTTLGGYLSKPFAVHAFLQGDVFLGQGLGLFTANEIATVTHLFKSMQLSCQWFADLKPMIWEKFAINCSVNYLTALFSCKNGQLMAQQNMLAQLTDEIALVLAGLLEKPWSGEALLEKVNQVLTNTAENYSSMYQDIHHHRLTEIAYLNGYLIQLAQKQNIKIPVNEEYLKQFYQRFPEQRKELVLSSV